MEFRMLRNLPHISLTVLGWLLILFASQAFPQGARPVSEMTEGEQHEFLIRTLDAGLPESVIDQLGLLALNRSEFVIPELVRRIKAAIYDRRLDDRTVALMAGMVAYPGNEQAIDGVAALCEIAPERFGFLAARALDYTVERKNPYSLAYYALARHMNLELFVLDWVQEGMRFPSNANRLARVLVDRYHGYPKAEDLRFDPLVSKMKAGLPDSVRREMDSLARASYETPRQ